MSEYLFQLHFEDSAIYRRKLSRFIAEWHEQHGSAPNDRYASYEAFWVSRKSPPPGSTTPSPSERRPLAAARFMPDTAVRAR